MKRNRTCLYSLIIWGSVLPGLFSQNISPEYHEAPDQPRMQVNPSTRATSPSFQYQGPGFWMTQVNVDAAGNNMVGDAANEPSLAVDPTNPQRMAIGWRQFDTIASNFRQAGYGYTLDGGQSWTFPGVIESGVFRSDPVLDSDADGLFYYNSLTSDSIFHCSVFQSTGDGTWDDGTPAFGGDKQWMVIDKSNGPGNGFVYANWSAGYSACSPNNFTRSTDGGATFDSCSLITKSLKWGTLNIGPEGELYAIGYNGQLAKSINAQLSSSPVTWEVSNINQGGYPAVGSPLSPNPEGLLGQPWIATDHSDGPTHGYIYALSTVTPFDSNGDPLDIHFNRSTDGGLTWSPYMRINDDNSSDNWQWFGTMSVAPNGRIDVVWLDTRDHPGTYQSSLYYSFSDDGGLTWSLNAQLTEAFDPHLGWPNQQKMGDYYHMVSDNDGAHLAFAATFNGEQDVYYGYISQESTSISENSPAADQLFQNYPNPVQSYTTLPYALHQGTHVQLRITHQTGQLVRILDQGFQEAGKTAANWDGKTSTGLDVPPGLYFYELIVDGRTAMCRKLVVVDGF